MARLTALKFCAFAAAMFALARPALAQEAAVIDPAAERQDITSFVQPFDPGLPREGEPGVGADLGDVSWFFVDLRNNSAEPLARIIRFVDPAPGRFDFFAGGARHEIVQVLASSEGVELEMLRGMQNPGARIVLPSGEAVTIAVAVADPSAEAGVELWTQNALTRYEQATLLAAALLAGILIAAGAYLAGIAVLNREVKPALAASAMGAGAGALLAHHYVFGRIVLWDVMPAPAVAAAIAALAAGFAVAYLRRALPLEQAGRYFAQGFRILQWGFFALAPFAAAALPVKGLASLMIGIGAGAALFCVLRLSRQGEVNARRLLPAAFVLTASSLGGALYLLWLGRMWPGLDNLVSSGLTIGLALIAFAAGPVGRAEDAAPVEPERLIRPRPPRVPAPEAQDGSGRYALALAASHQGVWDFDVAQEKLYVSASVEAMLGLPPGSFSGSERNWANRIHTEDREVYDSALDAYRAQGNAAFAVEFRMKHADSGYRWLQLRASCIAEDGEAKRCIGVITDITNRKGQEQRLAHDAVHDALTGLPNRALFLDRLQRAIEAGKREGKSDAALIALDLDRFKTINDGLGHAAGDSVLMEVARRIERVAGAADTVARLGSDEFAILLEGEAEARIASLVEALAKSVSGPQDVSGQEVFASVSAGIAPIRATHGFAEDVLREAEIALYHAKRKGTGQSESYDPKFESKAGEALELETDLRRALENREIELRYQPIMALENGCVAGFEALLRWSHGTRGLLGADEFVPLAEETGLIVPLGRYALARAGEELARWQKFFPLKRPLFVSVNVSGRQILRSELARDFADALKRDGLEAGTLKLEITESAVMANPEAAIAALLHLKELGAGLALDDFGTGFSSLSYLQRYPFDTIKIDKSFIETLVTKEESRVIVQTIVRLAHELGMAVVAEGVENAETAARLKDMGCDFAQGFHYGQALGAVEAQGFIAQNWRVPA